MFALLVVLWDAPVEVAGASGIILPLHFRPYNKIKQSPSRLHNELIYGRLQGDLVPVC